MAWLDCAASTLDTDSAFHSGATVEFIRGNLIHAQAQSGYDVQTYHHSTFELVHDLSSADAWERFEQFHCYVLPARHNDGAGWRSVRVLANGKCATGSTVATVRLYLGDAERDGIPHSTTGWTNWSAYGELVFSTSSLALASTTVHVARVGGIGPVNWSSAMPWSMRVVFVNALVKSDTIQRVTLVGPRFDEEAS
jgi:hypothetical protein